MGVGMGMGRAGLPPCLVPLAGSKDSLTGLSGENSHASNWPCTNLYSTKHDARASQPHLALTVGMTAQTRPYRLASLLVLLLVGVDLLLKGRWKLDVFTNGIAIRLSLQNAWLLRLAVR